MFARSITGPALVRLAPVLLLGACGASEPAPVERTGARLVALRPALDATDEPARGIARFDIHRTRPDWLFRAARAQVVELEDGRFALELSGGVGPLRELEVLVPGRFDPAEVNLISASVIVPDQRTLAGGLVRDGQRVTKLDPVIVEGAKGVRTFELRLGAPDGWEECERLAFSVSGEGAPIRLLSLEARWEPRVSSMPPLDSPQLIEIDGHWLRVTGLSSRTPLAATLRVPPGGLLRVDYGLPFEARLADSAPYGLVVLGNEDGILRQHLLTFEYDSNPTYSVGRRLDRQEIWLERALAKVRDPQKRELLRVNYKRQQGKVSPKLFGDLDPALEARLEEQKLAPTLAKTGLIDGWLSIEVPLDDLAGQQVSLRLELVEGELSESICAIAEPRLVVPAPTAPLVLLITSEAHRAEGLSAGDPDAPIQTPWLDRLAERGVVFSEAWAPALGTSASHAALMTAVSPRDSGLARDGQVVPELALTLAERFREEGFATVASVSSALLAPEVSGLGQGFDRVLAPLEWERGTTSAVDDLVSALQGLRGVPVFAWVHVREGCAPYEPPERFSREYYPEASDPYALDIKPPERVPDWAPDVRDIEYVRALYLSELTWLDRQLQQLVEHTRVRRGVVAFAGVYGESPTTFRHDRLEPATLRVPVVVAGGRLPAGKRVERPVELLALGRTLLELAGLEAAGFPGASLLERSRDEEEPPRLAIGERGTEASISRAGFMLVMRLAAPDRHGVRLYDFATNDNRRRDVLSEHPELASELRGQLVDWLLEAREPKTDASTRIDDPRLLRRLEALGIDPRERAPYASAWIARDCKCAPCTAAANGAPE